MIQTFTTTLMVAVESDSFCNVQPLNPRGKTSEKTVLEPLFMGFCCSFRGVGSLCVPTPWVVGKIMGLEKVTPV